MVKKNPKFSHFPRQMLTNNEDNDNYLAKISLDITVNDAIYSYNVSEASEASEIVVEEEGVDY